MPQPFTDDERVTLFAALLQAKADGDVAAVEELAALAADPDAYRDIVGGDDQPAGGPAGKTFR